MDALAQALVSLVQRRVRPEGQPLFVHRHGEDLLLYRLARAMLVPGEDESITPVSHLASLLDELPQELASESDRVRRSEASLCMLAGLACETGLLLARQMGATVELPVTGRELGFLAEYPAWQKALDQTWQSLSSLKSALIDSVRRDLKAPGSAGLQFERRGERVHVLHRCYDGKTIGEETLEEFATRLSSNCTTQYRSYEQRFDQLFCHHLATARSKLQARCPEVAGAVEVAEQAGQCVGYRIASARLRGLPADIVLYLDPRDGALSFLRQPYVDSSAATLVARRGHEEFVLENSAGKLFYFPPIQLVARIDFRLLPQEIRLAGPRVRMPAGGPFWNHPYTSTLRDDPLASAEMLSQPAEEPMCPISTVGRKLTAAAANRRPLTKPGCNHFCLDDQATLVSRLQGQLRRAFRSGREPPVRSVVEQLWTLARLGLTRGHQLNESTPRAALDSSEMPYAVPSYSAIRKTKLADRLFPFDPAKTPSGRRRRLRRWS